MHHPSTRRQKISLVVPPMLIRRCPLIGIGYLVSSLRAQGHEVKLFDLNVMTDLPHADEESPWSRPSFVADFFAKNPNIIEKWLSAILKDEPSVVAFTVWCSTVETVMRLAELIHQRGSNPLIVLGGPHAGFTVEELIKIPYVDAVVVGEGEETFGDLLETYAAGRLEAVPGSIVKTERGILVGEKRKEIADLNTLPFPDFRDFDLDAYRMSDTLPLSFNRGCLRRCVFCNIHESWKTYRHRSAENILREIELQLDRHPKVCHFEIDVAALNLDLKELGDLCDLIQGSGRKFSWGGSALFRSDMDIAFLRKAAKAGLRRMDIGFESGSPKILREMLKGYRIEDAERILRDCVEVGIEVLLNVIVGFPGETDDDYRMTKDFLLRNRRCFSGTGPASELYVGYGNELSHRPAAFGIDPRSLNVISGRQLSDCWKTFDGKNDHGSRQARVDDFRSWALENGISIASNDVSKASCGQAQ